MSLKKNDIALFNCVHLPLNAVYTDNIISVRSRRVNTCQTLLRIVIFKFLYT